MRAATARVAVAASLLAALAGGVARAEDAPPSDDLPAIQKYYPPPVDGPALRLPEPPTRLYLDAAYAVSDDLSVLPYIAGKASNFRFAAGGTWRWHRFSFDAEIPFANVTTLNLTMVSGGPPNPTEQTGTAFGDIRLGAVWTERIADEAAIAGLGLRTRLATHTTRFNFLMYGTYMPITDAFPYYFHIEPTAILGGAIGRFTYVVNEGVLVMIGPDGNVLDMPVIVPTLMFWDSHVAVSYAPWDFLGGSVEVGTDIQINHVNDPQFMINDLRSIWVAPALQFHVGDWRVDAIARVGIGHRSGAFGVLEYVGTDSYTLRLTRAFN